jgi:hypothetical protein
MGVTGSTTSAPNVGGRMYLLRTGQTLCTITAVVSVGATVFALLRHETEAAEIGAGIAALTGLASLGYRALSGVLRRHTGEVQIQF